MTLVFWRKHHIEDRAAFITYDFLAGLLKCILVTEEVEGNLVEFGTYKGGTTVPMAYLLKLIGSEKQIFACDTFKGHPYDDKFASHFMGKKGIFSDTSAQYVYEELKRLQVADKIVIVEGVFEETLNSVIGDERFSLAFIDCDLYESTKTVLEFLSTRMNPRGRIVLHDYGGPWFGITKAVNEWCEKSGRKVNFDLVPYIEFL